MYCLNHLIATRLEVPSCGTISDFHICKSLIRGRGKQRAICVRMANIDCRVAHLTISFANGGRREVIRSLMRHLPDYGVSSSLCCLTELGCPREEAPGAVLVNKRSLFDFPAIRRLAEFCDTNRVSVIHAHDASSQFAGALLRLIWPRTRLLMTFHRSLNFESASRSSRIRNALAGLLSQAVVTVSRERTEHYLQQTAIPARKVILIPNGVDTERFRPEPADRERIRRELGIGPDCVLFGAVGHFGPEKGLDIVLRAWQLLHSRRPELSATLVILGTGDATRTNLLREAALCCPPDSVRFLGFRANVNEYMRAFDVAAHAPRAESFGLAVIEAMATGVPVVATAVGGIPDIVREGVTGVLSPANNHEALSMAMEGMLNHETRESMGVSARSVAVAEYSVERCAAAYANLYRRII